MMILYIKFVQIKIQEDLPLKMLWNKRIVFLQEVYDYELCFFVSDDIKNFINKEVEYHLRVILFI